ncbi:YjiH family protein [Staphylococcus sp. Marseille-Q5304]|uniref:YjiH family protein n=1 Tax=Staphylococcus sp. Marseille-Q5304 TaxID=2942200 RepID=UPI002073D0B6|nr:YjiH family protein [Staphylococcus sp. Marseille-Q5304]
MWKFFVYSLIGIIVFFIPITLFGESTILVDHIVKWITAWVKPILPFYVLCLIIIGAVLPFVNKEWNKSKTSIVFSLFKVLGVFIAIMVVFHIGPHFILKKDIGPFLYDKLAMPLSLLIPIGAILLSFLVGYGLLEFIGVLCRPIMRPIFKTPGKSAVDAVASFVGSYSIGLLITNRVYKNGGYTHKEAVVIATGFSTVSATFMIIVANTLKIIDFWNLYFWFTLVVTFIVTAITVQLPPIRFEKNDTFENQPYQKEVRRDMPLLKEAWLEAKQAVGQANSLVDNVKENLRDGVLMTISILPSIMSIGLIGLLIVEFTPIVEYVAYIFYPFISIFPVKDVGVLAQASTISIVEMLLPSAIAQSADLATRFVVAVTSVSAIIFFSSVVPVILSTEIKVSIGKLVVIWFERVVLTLLITIPFALWIF